jgi:hypothetical protein
MEAEIGFNKGLVSFTYNGITLAFDTDGNGTVNGTEPYTLNPKPMFVNNRTLIAADTLKEVFGLVITWQRNWNMDWSGFYDHTDELYEQFYSGEIDFNEYNILHQELWDLFDLSVYSVSVIDLNDLLNGIDERFTVFNTMLSLSVPQNSIAASGTLTGKVDIAVPLFFGFGSLSSNFSVPFELDFDMKTDGKNIAGSLLADMDLDAVLPMMQMFSDAESMSVLEMLHEFVMSFILNSDDNLWYFHIPLLNVLEEINPDAWHVFNPGLDASYGTPVLPETVTVSWMFDYILRVMAEENIYIDYETVAVIIGVLDAFFGDDSFTVSGDAGAPVYSLDYTLEELMETLYGLMAAITDETELDDFDEAMEELHSMFDVFDIGFKLSFAPGTGGAYRSSTEFWLTVKDEWNDVEFSLAAAESFPGVSEMNFLMRIKADGINVSVEAFYTGITEYYFGEIPSAPPADSVIIDAAQSF